jgi:fructosamine-3-kinase
VNVNERLLNERIDPYLTADRLTEIARLALGRPVSARGARILTGGCWNRVIAVELAGGEPPLVYKINPEPGNAGVAREYAVLRCFAGTGMPVPEPYCLDASGSIIPGTVLVMKKVAGQVMHHVFGSLGPADRRRVIEEIAHAVGRLHRRRAPGFGGVELDAGERAEEWADFWLPRFDRVFEDVAAKDLLAPSFLDEVVRARERFAAHLRIGREATLTHYDIWSGNVMIDRGEDGFHVSGFIDIPGHWADYARELSFMEMFGVADALVYRIYREYRELDAGFELRKSIYNLKMHLRHITMYPDELYYRRGAEACLRHIQRAA